LLKESDIKGLNSLFLVADKNKKWEMIFF